MTRRRMLVVPSPSLNPLSTAVPIPTDGQMQSCPHLEWVKPAAETDYRCCDEQTPYPFTVAVWQEVAHRLAYTPGHRGAQVPYCEPCSARAGDWVEWTGEHLAVDGGAVVATVEVTGKGHDADECLHRTGETFVRGGVELPASDSCHPDALPDCWHTPTGQVHRLDHPIPTERPVEVRDVLEGPGLPPAVGDDVEVPASSWWADLDLEVPA